MRPKKTKTRIEVNSTNASLTCRVQSGILISVTNVFPKKG